MLSRKWHAISPGTLIALHRKWPTLGCSELDRTTAAMSSVSDELSGSGVGAEWWQGDVNHPLVHSSNIVVDDVFKYECYYLLPQTISSWLDAFGNALGTLGTVHILFAVITDSVLLTGARAGHHHTSYTKRLLIGIPTFLSGLAIMAVYIYQYFVMTKGTELVPMPSTADCFIALWFGGGLIWLGLKVGLTCCYDPALKKGLEVKKEIMEKRLKDAEYEETEFEEIRTERRASMEAIAKLNTTVHDAKDKFKQSLAKPSGGTPDRAEDEGDGEMGFGGGF